MLTGSVLRHEPADAQFVRTRAEDPQELGTLGVVFGQTFGEGGCAAMVCGRAPSAARKWSERRSIEISSAGSCRWARCRMM
ncbi:hypothetical protein [Kribbella voronezhensis]|uniref:hypothetical protein n=1 Tax=Kribbella voronezhensis TaxID=2512212 RepID=UPI0010639EFC|nr:hypothetical protein [Kribbella voronezhensis]